MIKHALRSIRLLAETVMVRTALAVAPEKAVSKEIGESWLFDDQRNTSRIYDLPVYPSSGELTDGQKHRLEVLDATLEQLSVRMSALLELTQSVTRFAGTTERAIAAEAVRPATVMAKRLVDPVISDVLFGDAGGRPELDADLFEIEADGMPAYQIHQMARVMRGVAAQNIRWGG